MHRALSSAKCMGDMNLKEVLVFIDDIIVFSPTLEEHEASLMKVLNRLKEFGLKLSLEKCMFFQTSVRYLGHVVSSNGVETDPEKVATLTTRRPTSRSEPRPAGSPPCSQTDTPAEDADAVAGGKKEARDRGGGGSRLQGLFGLISPSIHHTHVARSSKHTHIHSSPSSMAFEVVVVVGGMGCKSVRGTWNPEGTLVT